MVVQRIDKPKKQAGKRFLENRDPKIHENDKKAMFIKGGNTSEVVSHVLKELYMLKKTNAVMFQRKNMLRPFEDQTSIEFFSNKSDASLFLFGSHSKKKPNNLVLGRLFHFHMLDMLELGIEKFVSMSEFKCAKCSQGIKPCLVFAGEAFEQDLAYKRLKSLLIDFFRGSTVEKVCLSGLEQVMSFTVVNGKIYLRTYRIQLKKSGTRVPRVELEETGPSLDLVLKRNKLASADLYKRACRKPAAAKVKKVKNISRDPFGSKLGRIHMTKQDLDKLQTRKMKGLKRKPKRKDTEGKPEQEQNLKKAKMTEVESNNE